MPCSRRFSNFSSYPAEAFTGPALVVVVVACCAASVAYRVTIPARCFVAVLTLSACVLAVSVQ